MLRAAMGVMFLSFNFDEIASIINARSLAIVGASGVPMKFGSFYTSAQLQMDFDGPLYLVNPHEKEIMGREVYPDLKSLPETPDVVALTIPAHRSIEMLRDCAELGVKGVIMIASGFREIGEQGRALEKEAIKLAREGGFRIVGPNCFGIYNPRNRMTVLPGYDFSKTPGRIAFISQSGGYSVHVARQAQSLGLGFSAVVSYGNAADLNETDFLRYFTQDGQTDVIAGYLEGVMDGEGFPGRSRRLLLPSRLSCGRSAVRNPRGAPSYLTRGRWREPPRYGKGSSASITSSPLPGWTRWLTSSSRSNTWGADPANVFSWPAEAAGSGPTLAISPRPRGLPFRRSKEDASRGCRLS